MHDRLNRDGARRRDRSRGGWLLVLLVLAFSLVAGVAQAADWGYALGSELMSPYCPGRTLSSCPSPQAAELVQWIVTQEAAGATREEVIEILIERFGDEILGAPPAEGITLWAYIFPVAGFVLFGGIALLVLRRVVVSSSPPSPLAAPSAEVSSARPDPTSDRGEDDLARLVDAELASRS